MAANKRNANGAGGGFEKGSSGNPGRRFGQPDGNPTDRGGRPKSLASAIREQVGDDAADLITELLKIARGRKVSAAAKVQAIRELLDRGGWPKAPVLIEANVHVDADHAHRTELIKFMTDEELDTWSGIVERVEERMRAAGALPPAEPARATHPLTTEAALRQIGQAPR